MKLSIEVNLDDVFISDEALGCMMKETIEEAVRSELRRAIKDDKDLKTHIQRLKKEMISKMIGGKNGVT
jgi:hypothetical protein